MIVSPGKTYASVQVEEKETEGTDEDEVIVPE